VLIALVLGVAACVASFYGTRLGARAFDYAAPDVWFHADTSRVVNNMTEPSARHYRTDVHPLFSLLTNPPVCVLGGVLGMHRITAVQALIAIVAGVWMSMLFLLLRLISCRRLDALLFCALAASSATTMFWFSVPETYSFGSVSILAALSVVGFERYKKLSDGWYIGTSAFTLSFTITNWMAGILAVFTSRPWKRSLQLTVQAFGLVVLLWGIQKLAFPSVEFFLGNLEEVKFILTPESGGPVHVLLSFLYHTMVMPAINLLANPTAQDWRIMTIQLSLPGTGPFAGKLLVAEWTALLVLGLFALFLISQHLRFRIVLGCTLLGQLLLHQFYGGETFLYSLHFSPLLIILAALSTLTRARPVALLLAGTLAMGAAVNNVIQYSEALELVQSFSQKGPAQVPPIASSRSLTAAVTVPVPPLPRSAD
jgi:hypothetical protein